MKLGSLFDGSGGFPLAGSLCGITPVWASEVEPYPIAVTRSRFPGMKHIGSVTEVHGGEIEPVDVITFGSPCQDLSVAGKRAGLKHESNGDDETTRSGLFMEAIRIIREMREKTNGVYPTFAVWENVPGAFSSNGGEDFRTVLEEFVRIKEPEAVMPPVPKAGWAYADCIVGDGWSIAYRVFDAQYWGVPQRRRRIYLVADFGGQRAGEILFEREGLRGYFETGTTPWEGAASDVESGAGADDCTRRCVGFPIGFRPENVRLYDETATTICNGTRPGFCNGIIVKYALPFDTTQVTSPQNRSNPKWGDPCHPLAAQGNPPAVVCKCYDIGEARLRTPNEYEEVCPTLTARCGTGGNNVPAVVYDARGNGDGYTINTITGDHENRITDYTSIICEAIPIHDKATRYKGGGPTRNEDGAGNGLGVGKPGDPVPTLSTCDHHMVCYCMANGQAKAEILEDKCPCLNCNHEQPIVAGVDCRNGRLNGDLCGTLQAKPNGGFSYNCIHPAIIQRHLRYIVRRLTPTECARLQGFPDDWGHPDRKDGFTHEEYGFWMKVRNNHAAINGKPQKDYTKDQMLTWYNKLHTDSSEYKMWGNGIALPTALYVMQGIADSLEMDNAVAVQEDLI